MEEVEEQINTAEAWIQSSEDVLSQLVKLQVQAEAKLTWRGDNVRIHRVKDGAEESMTPFFYSAKYRESVPGARSETSD